MFNFNTDLVEQDLEYYYISLWSTYITYMANK